MDETLWGLVNILGPLILLVALLWIVLRSRRSRGGGDGRGNIGTGTRDETGTEAATHRLYDEEERRRREGTDGL
jgi:hypothetical protein